ncbi:MAG: hypothetical protein KME59_03840 [Trichormus sp. ATA11-4-KO1]|jgi:hypothetical protein|nr:hypothetical protein [Trichormus sp. ATA11-4-KO1]
MDKVEVRKHLEMETQRQWSDQSIARTTPTLLGLFSVESVPIFRASSLFQGRIEALLIKQNALFDTIYFDFEQLATVYTNDLCVHQASLTGCGDGFTQAWLV